MRADPEPNDNLCSHDGKRAMSESDSRSYQEESLIRNAASAGQPAAASTGCHVLLGRSRQLHCQPTLDTALSAIAFGPRTLHFSKDGRIDDQTAEGRYCAHVHPGAN